MACLLLRTASGASVEAMGARMLPVDSTRIERSRLRVLHDTEVGVALSSTRLQFGRTIEIGRAA